MNDQNLDLIIALIEGSLSEQDAAAASARIAADPELTAEYEIQKTISASLSSVEPIAMTAEERTNLRGSLTSQLNLEEAPAATPAPTASRESAWWWRPALALSSAAAVLVLGIAVVPDLVGQGSDDSGAEVAAFEAVGEEQGADGGDADTTGSGSDGAVTTAPAAAAPLEVPNLRSTDLDDMLDSVAGESAPSEIEEEALKFASPDGTVSILPDEVATCRELLGNALPDGSIQIIGAEKGDHGLVVTIALVDDEGAEALARIDVATCVLVDVAE